jgi:hypothetical protein
VNWFTATTLGACGGAIVSLVAFCADIFAWQQARRTAREKRATKLPLLKNYIDLPADILALVTRIALGAAAGAIFHSEVTGLQAAIAVGASAPVLLSQLGNARTVKTAAEEGTEQPAIPSIGLANADPPISEEA